MLFKRADLERSKSKLSFDLIQRLLLYSLPILAVVGIAATLALHQYNFSLLGSYLALPMILSSVAYLRCRQDFSDCRTFGRSLFYFLTSLYLINFVASIIILETFSVRPLAYYVLITIMITLILFSILFTEIDRKMTIIILLQIMILVLNLIWGVNLNYYYFIGRTDAISCAWLIENLIKQGWITDLFGIYKPFPLWHILVSFFYLVTGIHMPVHKAMFFTNGLIYSFLVPLIYLISLKISKNVKIALLSSLFMVIYSDTIFYGMYSLSRSVVSFLEVLLVLLLLNRDSPSRAFLYIIVIFSIILFHTASMPFIILIFSIIWLFQRLLRIEIKDLLLTNYCIMLMIVATLSYWIFVANDLFEVIISDITTSAPSGVLTKSIINTPLNELFNYLQYSPFIFFTLFGILVSLKSNKILISKKIFFLVALLMIPVTFPGPSLLINKLANNFNLARFGEYSFLFILLAAAFGFGILFYRSSKNMKILLILVFILMSFLSTSNDFIATDNPLVKRPFYTFYLTNEEITCFNHIYNLSKGYLMSDHVTTSFISRSRSPLNTYSKEHILEVDVENMTFLRNSSEDIILLRSGELRKRPLSLFTAEDGIFIPDPNTGISPDYYYGDLRIWGTLKRYDKVFDSNQIGGYV